MPDANSAASILREPAQSKRTWTFEKSNFVWKFIGKMPDANSAASVLREPAQSKRTWTFHKIHFVWKFIGKMPDAYENTSIKHRALTLIVRTLSVWPHSLGKNYGKSRSFTGKSTINGPCSTAMLNYQRVKWMLWVYPGIFFCAEVR